MDLFSVIRQRYNINDIEMVSIKLEMYKTHIEKLIKSGVHTAKITEPKTDGGMWNTYVFDDAMPNNRRQIQARTEYGFYRSLYEWYYPHGERYKKATITSLVEDVIDYKREVILNDEETLKRFQLVFNKSYKGTKFANTRIDRITANDCEDFFNSIIDKGIKEKAFNSIIGVANAVFDYARRRIHIIDKSPLEDAHINRKLLIRRLDESDEDRVYFPDERDALFTVIKRHLAEPEYVKKVDLIAILLAFKLALRLGELVAICYSDISLRFGTISIWKMEKCKRHEVVPHTKSYEERKLPLSDYEIGLITKIKEYTKDMKADGDYIIINYDGRREGRGLDNTLRDLCDEAGIPQKSFHDIRRTVASEMHANGCTLEEIRKYLGHADIKTTQGYIYNLKRSSEYSKTVHNSLKNNQIDFD